MKKEVWKFSNFSTADPSLAYSHWLWPDLDADELILIVLIEKAVTQLSGGKLQHIHYEEMKICL